MFKPKPIRPDVGAIDNLIGPQVTIRGDVMFSGGLYVEGHIQGKVIAEAGERAVLTLAEQGSIEGEIQAPVVVINDDARTPHQSVVDVMQAAQRAGLPHITFATQAPAQ